MVLISGSQQPQWLERPDRFAQIGPALQHVAVQWELLDPREVRYVLGRPEDSLSDLAIVQKRYQDLQGAPWLYDRLRFPDRQTVNEFLAFNRAYRRTIDVRQPLELHNWWQMRAALQETDRLYLVWDLVRDAQCHYYYVSVRRNALKRLKEMIGDEAYYSGKLPPYVPLHHFASMD